MTGVTGVADIETDGRRLRRTRNREAAVDALIALYGEGNLTPSSAEIAERAGLSPRSLFRYFDDVDDLVRAAIEQRSAVLVPLLERRVDVTASRSDRILQLVELRLSLYETIGRVGRVARLRAPFNDRIRTNLTVMRRTLRHQIEDAMGAELDAMAVERRTAVLAAADVVCSYESYDLLIEDQGLDLDQRRTVLVTALTALFD